MNGQPWLDKYALLVFGLCLLLSPTDLCAETESFVTKDGQVITGEVVMRGNNAVAVRTADGTVTLSLADVMEVAPEEVEAYRLLWQGRQCRAEADKAFEARELGSASYYYETALERLRAVPDDAAKPSASAQELVEQIEPRLQQIKADLDGRGLAAYRGQLFKKAILEYHLSKGHALVGTATWVEPSQLCSRCQGKRWIACTACSGTGTIYSDCPYCEGGRIPNPVGNGTGEAVCPDCGGSGVVQVGCPTCHGRGQVGCATCRAKGTVRVKCRACGGKGYSERTIELHDSSGNRYWGKEKIDCPVCGGKGRYDIKCPDCGGTGLVTCRRCGGNGLVPSSCTRCAGHGKIVVSRTISCPHCHFGWIQTVCEVCRGKRYVPCPDCEGRGFTGDPIPDPAPPAATDSS